MTVRRLPLVLVALACVASWTARTASAAPLPPNTLSPEEKRAGFVLLFDGKTTDGWRGFNRTEMPKNGWKVVDGTLAYEPVGPDSDKPGDIVTEAEFDNFELRLEWKLSPGGNSGVKYLVNEARVSSGHNGLAFEMQILDDDKHPDAKKGIAGNRTAGALYDLIPPSKAMAKPIGEWNDARLVVKGSHVEHWLNGHKVVEYDRDSQMMRALINTSKYKDIEGFGTDARGRLLLQDHGDAVWYRNVRVRKLAAPRTKAAAAGPMPAKTSNRD
ncbi:MAG: DUF1080 domain-containing protein [Myxococcales bacterium]|nr:DUF1080 domain-containing protein [Myxococcales bacterium]